MFHRDAIRCATGRGGGQRGRGGWVGERGDNEAGGFLLVRGYIYIYIYLYIHIYTLGAFRGI